MVCCWSQVRNRLERWVRDYDSLQHLAVILLYIQIGSALIGSLGAAYTGVLLVNLAVALFALVAIESSSQSLGRTYALLLPSSILLDLAWFLLFSRDICSASPLHHSSSFIFSVRLTFSMQILGFSLRLSSSFLWIQIYRLGISTVANSSPPDYHLRNSFLSPSTPALPRECSDSNSNDVVLGGSIYDPTYYSSLFQDAPDNTFLHHHDQIPGIGGNGSSSSIEAHQLKVSTEDVEETMRDKLQTA